MFEELTIILRLTVLNIRFFLLIKGFLTAKTFKIYYEISKDSYPQKARKVYELVMMHENMNGEMSRNYLFKCKNPHGPSLHRGLRRGGVGIEPTKTTSTTYKDIRTDRLNLFFYVWKLPQPCSHVDSQYQQWRSKLKSNLSGIHMTFIEFNSTYTQRTRMQHKIVFKYYCKKVIK